jgi:hypothetical protein
MEKEYTREQVLDFKESDWEFRRSSGYAGYDHKDSPNNEQKWIYESDYSKRKSLKAQYEYEYKLISDFRRDHLPFGEYPDYHIQEFLDKKFFKQ